MTQDRVAYLAAGTEKRRLASGRNAVVWIVHLCFSIVKYYDCEVCMSPAWDLKKTQVNKFFLNLNHIKYKNLKCGCCELVAVTESIACSWQASSNGCRLPESKRIKYCSRNWRTISAPAILQRNDALGDGRFESSATSNPIWGGRSLPS